MTEITVNANVSINTMTYEDIQKFMDSQQKNLLSIMGRDWMTCDEILAAYRKAGGNYYTSPGGIASALCRGDITQKRVESRNNRVYYYTCRCDEFGNRLGEPIKHCELRPQYRLR